MSNVVVGKQQNDPNWHLSKERINEIQGRFNDDEYQRCQCKNRSCNKFKQSCYEKKQEKISSISPKT